MTLSYALVIQRKLIEQALFKRLRKATGACLYCERDYARAEQLIGAHKVAAALLEVAESGAYDITLCLALCTRLKSTGCKFVLLCPEQSKQVVTAATDALKRGIIDDFVYYDSSLDYLAAKLLSISMPDNSN